jgi:hypothetical protein
LGWHDASCTRGAWDLFTAFDIQTGKVIAQLHRRKCQKETISLLEATDRDTPKSVKTIHFLISIYLFRGGP